MRKCADMCSTWNFGFQFYVHLFNANCSVVKFVIAITVSILSVRDTPSHKVVSCQHLLLYREYELSKVRSFIHWARLENFWVPQFLFLEIDRLAESVKNLSENITNTMNDFEQSLKHETSGMKQLLNEEVLKLKETHQNEITRLRLEHQQNSTVLKQEFKQELATKTETLKRQMDDVGVRSTTLRNLTNTLSTNYNVLHAAQVRTQYTHCIFSI